MLAPFLILQLIKKKQNALNSMWMNLSHDTEMNPLMWCQPSCPVRQVPHNIKVKIIALVVSQGGVGHKIFAHPHPYKQTQAEGVSFRAHFLAVWMFTYLGCKFICRKLEIHVNRKWGYYYKRTELLSAVFIIFVCSKKLWQTFKLNCEN